MPPKTESPSRTHPEPLPQVQKKVQQNEEKPLLKLTRNMMTCCRRFRLWFKAVYLIRKEYVPGDTCRFICQKVPEVKRSFVYYRIFHFLGNFACFCISLSHFGVPSNKRLCEKPVTLCFGTVIRFNFEWLFYATSLGLLINAVQSVWGLVLTLKAYCRQERARKAVMDVESQGGGRIDRNVARKDNKLMSDSTDTPKVTHQGSERSEKSHTDSKDAGLRLVDSPSTIGSKMSNISKNLKRFIIPIPKKGASSSASKEHKILSKTGFYWGLHSYSICASLLIDTVYWTLIWPLLETSPTLYYIQFVEHGFNLPIMISEYCVVAFPMSSSHLWFTTIIPVSYMLCNLFWYLVGGKNDDRTKHFLYTFLDWKKPIKAVVFGLSISLGLTIFLFIFLVVDYYKFKFRPKALLNFAHENPPLL